MLYYLCCCCLMPRCISSLFCSDGAAKDIEDKGEDEDQEEEDGEGEEDEEDEGIEEWMSKIYQILDIRIRI